MKVYLDDERRTPEGWFRCLTAPGTISFLRENLGRVTHLSVDHDLGEDPGVGNGYDVLLWLEQYPQYAPADINVHSANAGAWKKMNMAIESIHKRRPV